ncbi:MAG: TIGR02646 family protein [SAR86 cluster bacterium]|uniref:TIGR02646 family protein n=1 Tax=SAR86 cluster bacterium TaxID=2030880 RepID=A0A2A4MPW8_9GAMM|nr:MAG: TIGR02646 family protein [SAR86 cluster bacterium]
MQKLLRCEAPACLASFKHGLDNWSVIATNNLTNDIWEKLNDMQHNYCAYCECKIPQDNKKRHIEHFIQRSKDPTLTFTWANIFGSCNNPNRCGNYKDESPAVKKIDLNKVCKPDVQNSGDFLIFLNSGKVRAKTKLTVQDSEIANNTITIFNLDGDSTLVNSRIAVIAGEKPLADEYWEWLAVEGSDEIAEFLETTLSDALIRIKGSAHSTALEHLWKYNEKF